MQRQLNSVIRNPSLGEVVGSDLLRTVPGSDLASSRLSLGRLLPFQFQVIQLGAKQPERLFLVLQL